MEGGHDGESNQSKAFETSCGSGKIKEYKAYGTRENLREKGGWNLCMADQKKIIMEIITLLQ